MAVLDFFGMFDYASGDDDTYKYSSTEFAELIEGITGTGVSANTLDCFTTTANGVTLTVKPGVAFIKGRYGSNHSSKAVTLSATTSTTSRYDRLVLQLDIENRKIEMLVIQGVAATSSPSIPALVQNELIYQIPLYLCLVSNGSTVTLTDERPMTYNTREIQLQLEERALSSHTHTLSQISGISLNTTASNIKMNGTQSAGSGTSVAKANHVHPTDTSRAAASHTHALADITGISLGTASPKINGTAAVGTSTAVSRQDHVHPTDTTRAAASHTHALADVTGISLSTASPKTNGTAAAGTSTAVSRQDHVHPTDTTRAAASHTHALADVTGISLSSTSPKMDGTAAAGSSTAVARYDHVHPTDTSRAAASHTHTLANVSGISLSSSSPKMNGTAAAGSSTAVARYDHVHPTDTSRAASSHTHSASEISNLTASKGSSNGIYYHKSADGLIVQWGTISTTEQGLFSVDLPLSYTSASSYVVMITPELAYGRESTAYISDKNTISIGLPSNSRDVNWLTIGY